MIRRVIGGGYATLTKGQFRGPADRDRTFVREGFRHHIRRFFGWVSPDRHQAMTGNGMDRLLPQQD